MVKNLFERGKTPFFLINWLARIILADFTILFLVSLFIAWVTSRFYLLRFPPALLTISIFSGLYSISTGLTALITRHFICKFYFAEPSVVLWFMPLLNLFISVVFFLGCLTVPPLFLGDSFWTEFSGLDTSRFQHLVKLSFEVLALNAFLTLPFAVPFYISCYAVRKFRGRRVPLITLDARRVLIILFLSLMVLVSYIFVVRRDMFDYYWIKTLYRFSDNPVRVSENLKDFLVSYPESRLADQARFLRARILFLELEKIEESEYELRKLIRENPETLWFGEATFFLARIAMTKKEPERARNIALEFVSSNPSSVLADDMLIISAQASLELGQKTAAVELLERVGREYDRADLFEFDRKGEFVSVLKAGDVARYMLSELRKN